MRHLRQKLTFHPVGFLCLFFCLQKFSFDPLGTIQFCQHLRGESVKFFSKLLQFPHARRFHKHFSSSMLPFNRLFI